MGKADDMGRIKKSIVYILSGVLFDLMDAVGVIRLNNLCITYSASNSFYIKQARD
jgi:hypothetical protein